MKEKSILVGICRVGQPMEMKVIVNKLEVMQEIVAGYLECVQITPDLDLWCDENGRNKKEFNREIVVSGHVGLYREYIYGNFFVARHDDDGNSTSLQEKNIEFLQLISDWGLRRVKLSSSRQ